MTRPTPAYEPGDVVWVHVPRWATFGLVVRDGRVVEAPPICRWAVGERERTVAEYLRHRGAQFRRVTALD